MLHAPQGIATTRFYAVFACLPWRWLVVLVLGLGACALPAMVDAIK